MINQTFTKPILDYRNETKLELRKRKLDIHIYERRLYNKNIGDESKEGNIENHINYNNDDIILNKSILINTESIFNFIVNSDSKNNIEALTYGLYRLKLDLTEIARETPEIIEEYFINFQQLIDQLRKYNSNKYILLEITRIFIIVTYYLKSDNLIEILYSDELIDNFAEILNCTSASNLIKSNILLVCGNALCSSSIRKRFLTSKIMEYFVAFINNSDNYLNEELLNQILWCFVRIMSIKPLLKATSVSLYFYIFIKGMSYIRVFLLF